MRRPPLPRSTARLAAGALLLLTLTACGDDPADTAEADSSESPSPSATTSEEPSPSESAESAESAGPRPKPAKSPDELSVDVTVQGDQVSPNAQVLEVEVGEPITLDITSDRPGELHIHTSPEQYVEFGAGRTTESFTVERPGSVEVEEHDSGAQVLRVLAQ